MKNETNKSIAKFIHHVGSKNFAAADKQLASIIENKLASRINNFKNIKLFKKS
jgi:hypothetical protein